MGGAAYGEAIRQTRALFEGGAVGSLSDRELLARYVARSDGAAFEAIVGRHGPMVLRACSAAIGDEHEADDAFQATFLVLVRKAGSIRVGDSLGPWLHEVARRVSACARSSSARRSRHERHAAERSARVVGGTEVDDLASVLHEEVGRLPDRYRTAVVLCDLEGLTQEQAASQLGWPLGTVRSRLARGRDRLRGRLVRRGLAPAALPLASPALPDAAVVAAVRLAVGGDVPLTVRLLSEGGLRAMRLIRWKSAALLTLAVGLATSGAGVLARRSLGQLPKAPAKAAAKVEGPPKAEGPAEDFPGEDQVIVRVAPSRTKVWAFSPITHAWRTYRTPEGVKIGEIQQGGMGGMGGMGGDGGMAGRMGGGGRMGVMGGGGQVVFFYPGISVGGQDDQVLAPVLEGDEIREVVAFNVPTGAWIRQALKEPARQSCTPYDGHRFAIYRVGRYLYGFSSATGRWDVRDLGEAVDTDKHVGETKNDAVIYPVGAVTADGRVLLHRPGEFARVPNNSPPSSEYSALIRVGRFVCGFSVPTGAWDVLDLGADNDNDFPFSKTMEFGGPATLVPRGDHLYHFNATTGKFQDIEADGPPPAGKPS